MLSHPSIRALLADITTLRVDAIVNAANTALTGGGGVDGAIHRAAGTELLEACLALEGCRTGEAKITKGYRLPASAVIHTVGPVWRGGGHGEAGKLAACYRNSIRLAAAHGCRSVAFPAISTGVYGYPVAEAAAIAIAAACDALQREPSIAEVIFCCFSEEDLKIYRNQLNELMA